MKLHKNPMCYYAMKVRPLFETTGDTKEQMWLSLSQKVSLRVECSKLGGKWDRTPLLLYAGEDQEI